MKRVFTVLIFISTHTVACAINPHPFSVSWATADIQENKISLSVKVLTEDLLYFHHIRYDTLFTVSKEKLLEAAHNHVKIIQSGFPILDQNKKLLPGVMISFNFSSLDAKDEYGIMELLKYPLYFQMEFKLSNTTELLTFQQVLNSAGIPSVSLLTVTSNGNSIIQNYELSKDQSLTIGRHAVSLGSPTESTFMLSYITLSDTKISHEMTLPFALLKTFITLNEQSVDTLKIFREFFANNSTVEINNVTIEPVLTNLVFQSDSENLVNDFTLVNIHVEYSLKALPKDVAISWNNFNWKVRWFKSLINSFGESDEHNFSRFQPTYKVKRKLTEAKEVKKEGN